MGQGPWLEVRDYGLEALGQALWVRGHGSGLSFGGHGLGLWIGGYGSGATQRVWEAAETSKRQPAGCRFRKILLKTKARGCRVLSGFKNQFFVVANRPVLGFDGIFVMVSRGLTATNVDDELLCRKHQYKRPLSSTRRVAHSHKSRRCATSRKIESEGS